RDLRDERVERVPEGERVAGMQAAVLELVDGAQMQVAEVDELAHPREVEEAVTGDDAGHVPQRDADSHPAGEDEAAAARTWDPERAPDTGGKRCGADPAEHGEGEGDAG